MEKPIPRFRLFSLFSLFFLVGLTLASFLTIDFNRSRPIFLLIFLGFLFSALVNRIIKAKNIALISFSLIFVLFGLGYYSFFNNNQKADLPFGETVLIEGKIVKKPDVDYKRQQVTIEIEKLIIDEEEQKDSERVLILVKLPHYPAFQYGDRIKFEGKIEKPGKIEDFDYGRYLKRYLIFGLISQPTDIINSTGKLSLKDESLRKLYSISSSFEASLNRILPEPHASLAAGLVLGVRKNIPDDFKNDLSTTGLTHIIALSGYNVTIIIIVISDLLSGRFNRQQVFLLGLLLTSFFVVMTGASSSVVRAAIFSLMIIFGRTIGRRGDQTNLLLLAALLMVLINPFILRDDLSFQLSFLAFAGIIYLSPIVAKFIEKSRITKWPDFITKTLTETLSAQIAVAPLLLFTFGQISLIAPFSNLLILWTIPVLMTIIFITGLAGIIFYPLGKLLTIITWPLLEYIIKFVTYLAKVPLASLKIENAVWVYGILLYIILIFASIYFSKRFKLKIL